MKRSKLAFLFLFLLLLMVYLLFLKHHFSFGPSSYRLPPHRRPGPDRTKADRSNSSRGVQYGIMFDAGSTGTRVHVFRFQMENEGAPRLDHETFRAIKPGLSAYADDPQKCSVGITELLDVARSSVPPSMWTRTPVVLKATAGLRLLPGEKADQLLDQVRVLFQESPFLSREDSVSIMDGTDEGISAWITINFLTGSGFIRCPDQDPSLPESLQRHSGKYSVQQSQNQSGRTEASIRISASGPLLSGSDGSGSGGGLQRSDSPTVGMLDLGGGSTQITFSPRDEKTIQTSPVDDIRSFQMFNRTHTVYTHSYLGLGLMSARLAVLGGVDAPPSGGSAELASPCLAPGFSGRWEHADVVYTVKGQKAGEPVYEACLNKVQKVLYRKLTEAPEAADVDFYAFSFYYDRAVDLRAVDEKKGGTIRVWDYIQAAERVCRGPPDLQNPFLCLDLVYISVLLQELGFPPHKQLRLARTIHQVETSWALGATFQHLEALRRH